MECGVAPPRGVLLVAHSQVEPLGDPLRLGGELLDGDATAALGLAAQLALREEVRVEIGLLALCVHLRCAVEAYGGPRHLNPLLYIARGQD